MFDSKLNTRKEFLGEEDRLDFGNTLYGKDLFVMHNHPRNSSNIKTLTIVKNNGNVEIISKTKDFNIEEAQKEIRRLIKSNIKTNSNREYDKVIEKFLNSNKGGIMYERNK